MTKVMDITTLTTSEIKSLLETLITDTSLNSQKIEALVKMLVNLNKRVLACENATTANKVRQ